MKTSFDVGDMTIHRIVEQETPTRDPLYHPMSFFPTLDQATLDENMSWMRGNGFDAEHGNVLLCFQSYILKTPHHTILIDTCIGNDKEHPTRPNWHLKSDERYMRGLKAAGLTVDDIDFVMCTHLHPDHVGWNTRKENGRWVPTFPKARYLFSEKELVHWTKEHAKNPITYMADSVLPIVEASRADLVTSDHALGDHVHFQPTPGHTPDHFAVRAKGKGGEVAFTGDCIHSPLQARYPELGMRADWNSELGGKSRRKFLESVCDTGATVCTAHFPSPSVGKFTRWGEGFRFTNDG